MTRNHSQRSALLFAVMIGLIGCNDENPLLGRWETADSETRLTCLIRGYIEFTDGLVKEDGGAMAVSYGREGSSRLVKMTDGTTWVAQISGDSMELNGCRLQRYVEGRHEKATPLSEGDRLSKMEKDKQLIDRLIK